MEDEGEESLYYHRCLINALPKSTCLLCVNKDAKSQGAYASMKIFTLTQVENIR